MPKVEEEHTKAIIAVLEELGGRTVKMDDITFEGNKFIIPENMSASGALDYLAAWIENQEEEHDFNRVYKFRPYDGANAVYEVLNQVYGGVMGQTTYNVFGQKIPPSFIDINVAFGATKQVPWGWVQFPLVEGQLYVGQREDDELGPVFHLLVRCPKKYRWAVEGLFVALDLYLANNSIYRGKAFDGKTVPNFLDLRKVDPTKVIYTDHVRQQLETNVWGAVRHTQAHRDYGLPLKRTVLLEGPYGTGKTLAAYLTAKEAVSHDWTFIYCRPGTDNLNEVLTTAKLYQPAVVFAEDIDTSTDAEYVEAEHVSKFMDAFDGIAVKNSEIVAILTTNHVDKIHKAMLRPGRFDAVIEIGPLDERGIELLCLSCIPEDYRGDIDWELVCKAMDGYLPAFVKEAVDRASRYSLVHNNGIVDRLNTDDLVQAANGLRDQLKLMEDAPEHHGVWTMDKAFSKLIDRRLQKVRNPIVFDDSYFTIDEGYEPAED